MTLESQVKPSFPQASPVPGPSGRPLVGVLPEMWRDPLHYFVRVSIEYNGLVQLPLARRRTHLVTRPDLVQQVLQERAHLYIKGKSIDLARELVGNGLATSDGALWQRQRRLMQPAFRRARLAGLVDIMVDTTRQHLKRWEAIAQAGEILDVAEEMMQVTLAIIVRTMFGADIAADLPTAMSAFRTALTYIDRRSFTLFDVHGRFPTRTRRQFHQAVATLDRIIYRIIEQRRRANTQQDDLLGMLLAARDPESGQGMDDKQLRDEVMTIFFAGHETTAVTLSWVWYLLSTHPDVGRRVYDEIMQVVGDRDPTAADLERLTFTRQVLDETLRLYPPAWIFVRMAAQEDVLDGYLIPAGASVMLSPYVTHRLPDIWPHPEGFDPERFAPGKERTRPRFAYIPFGGGPRKCIGNRFAIMEAMVVMALVLQRFDLELVPEVAVQPRPLVTLRPHPGVPVRLRPRA